MLTRGLSREERLCQIAMRLTRTLAVLEIERDRFERTCKPRKIKGKTENWYEFSDRCFAIRKEFDQKIRDLSKRRDKIRIARGWTD